MKCVFIILSLFVVASFVLADEKSAASSDWVNPTNTNVVKLDEKNFDRLVGLKSSSEWFIKFFQPWCGHCRSMAPNWEKLADLHKDDPAFPKIGKINCGENKNLCSRFGINGVPTVKYIRGTNGTEDGRRVYDFDRQRTVEAMTSFVKEGQFKSASFDMFPSPSQSLSKDFLSQLTARPVLLGVVILVLILAIAGFIYLVCDTLSIDKQEEAAASLSPSGSSLVPGPVPPSPATTLSPSSAMSNSATTSSETTSEATTEQSTATETTNNTEEPSNEQTAAENLKRRKSKRED